MVYRADRGHDPGYTETLTMSATPHLTNGAPDGTEAISGLQSLSRTYVSDGGQVTRQDDYFNLAGLTYSTALYIGTAGTNYYSTTVGYDARGHRRLPRPGVEISGRARRAQWAFDWYNWAEGTAHRHDQDEPPAHRGGSS
jgi:hypothetical protein